MMCEKCGKNAATVHIQNVINGKQSEVHLCGSCAAQSGLLSSMANPFFSAAPSDLFGNLESFFTGDFDSLFSGIGGFLPSAGNSGSCAAPGTQTDFFGTRTQGRENSETGACPLCGATPEDIAKTGRAGCPECYTSFKSIFAPIIRRIHGNATHTGSIPASAGEDLKRQRRIETLKSEMHAAVAAQEYEKAAELRDEIRSLEKEDGKSA